MNERSKIDGLTLFERIAKSQAQVPGISVTISLTDFEFQPIIDAIKNKSQFGLKYSDGAGVVLFDTDELIIVDYYAGETNVITPADANHFLEVIKLYLINHREIITPKEVKSYIDMKKKIILLN